MDSLKHLLPPKVVELIERAGIPTPKLLTLSIWDVQKLTHLNSDDVLLLKNIVAEYSSPKTVACDKLLQQENQSLRVSTSCNQIDSLLNGGFRRGILTEIYGESGSGKTQLGIQTAACNWSAGAVYICTEDLFPLKRFDQIKQSLPHYNSENDYGKNIYVEHITEPHELLSCIKVRLPKLLDKNKLSLIVIDSIAAPFRYESTNYIQRAEELRELAILLTHIAQQYNIAVICVNQVRASFDETESTLPSLGLAWSNMVNTRLCLKKTIEEIFYCGNKAQIRELCIDFAPDLPNSAKTKIIIIPTGIQGIE